MKFLYVLCSGTWLIKCLFQVLSEHPRGWETSLIIGLLFLILAEVQDRPARAQGEEDK